MVERDTRVTIGRPAQPAARILALVQGLYFVITAIWPLLNMTSFETVTGRKADRWLVRTMSGQLLVSGAVLCLTALRRRPLSTPEGPLVGAGSAAGTAAVEVATVAHCRMSPIYLLDAAVEIVFIAGWLLSWWRQPIWVGARRGKGGNSAL